MAAEEASAIEADDSVDTEVTAQDRSSRSRGRLILIAAGAVVLLVLLIGAGAYVTGVLDSLLGSGAEDASQPGMDAMEEAASLAPPVLFDLPEFIVNLNAPGRKARFLKVKARLELTDDEAAVLVEHALPRIIDAFQVYLRELRPDDLRGSAGTFRLREALLRRVGAQIGDGRVRNVLFVEIFTQ